MKKRLLVLCWMVLTATPLAAQQEDDPIQFLYLQATGDDERSAINGECDGGRSSFEITCRITQILISYSLDPSRFADELNQRIARAHDEVAGDIEAFAQKFCADVTPNVRQIESQLQNQGDLPGAQLVRETLAFCAQPSNTRLENWIRRQAEMETKTCKVKVFENAPVTFRKIAANKWIANVGPQGFCNAVYLYTLEHEPEHPSLWRWSQLRTYADSSDLCSGLEINKRLEFSWRSSPLPMKCESINFGF